MVASAPDRIRARVLFVALLAMIGWVHALFAGNADSFGLQRRLPSLEQLTVKGSVPHRAVAAPMAAAQTAASAPICDLFANGFDSPGATQCAACFDHARRALVRTRRSTTAKPISIAEAIADARGAQRTRFARSTAIA